MNIVFGLPEVLQATLLTEWVSLKEVGRLDSALCNSKLRPEYLRLTQLKMCTFLGNNYDPFDPEWIINRTIKLREVRLPNMNSELRTRFLQHLGKSSTESIVVDSKTYEMVGKNFFLDGVFTKKISSAEFEHILNSLSEHCSDVKHLQLECRRTFTFSENIFGSLSNLISNCQHLQRITMVSIIFLPVSFLEAICFAHCLEQLELDRCAFASDAQKQFTLTANQNINVLSFTCNNDSVWLCKAFPALQTIQINSLHDEACLADATQFCPLVTAATLDFVDNELLENLHDHIGAWCMLQNLCVKKQGRLVSLPEKAILWFVTNRRLLASITTEIKTMEMSVTLYPLHFGGSRLTRLCMCCDDTGSLATVLAQCPFLHTLYLVQGVVRGAINTTTFVPVEQSLHLLAGTNVKVFSLSSYAHLSDNDLLPLLHVNFHFFRLRNCGQTVTNNSILRVLASMPNLNTVEITLCPSVTYEVVTQLPSLCVKLRSFTFVSHDCFHCSHQTKFPDLVASILRKLHPHVTYWRVVC